MTDRLLRISQYLHGTIDPDGAAELANWIKADRRNADEFIREAFVHSQLGNRLRGESLLKNLDNNNELTGTTNCGIGSYQVPHQPMQIRSRRVRLVGLAASLILAVGVTTALIRHHVGQNRVASVTAMIDARWNGGPVITGATLAGGPYTLVSGLACVDFSEGSQVIVQGPATFSLDRKRLRLDSGQIVVSCPTRTSRSLVVETADARIVDLGTEYGVIAGPLTPTRVRVFQGSIQVTAKAKSQVPRVLHAGDEWQTEPDSQTQPPTHLVREGEFEISARSQSKSPDAPWARYLRGLLPDRSLIFCSDFNPLWDGKSVMNLARPDEPWLGGLDPAAPLQFVPGRLGDDQALSFSHLHQALRLDIPGRFPSLTLAAWIKLDPEPMGSQRHRGILMSDRWGEIGQVHWQIKRHGIRLSLFDRGDDEDPRYSANTELLFDGNWHQCVSIIDTTGGPAAGTVSHYVDGKIIYRRRILLAIPPLTLGKCCVGNWVPPQDDLADDRTLGGQVDDLLIWNRPLSATEIASLFKAESASLN